MKKLFITLIALSGLAASAQAAVLVGVDAGYLIDSEEEYLTARIGFEVSHANAYSHQVELEVGYSEADESGLSADLLPITANYRFVATTTERFGYHLGVGAGLARARIDGASIFGPVRLRDEALALQGFAGVNYQLAPAATLTAGVRYLWIDDVTFAGSTFEVGDDVAVSLGLSFRF